MSPLRRDDRIPLPALSESLANIRERIREACGRSGRPESAVRLMAVTKLVEAERINAVLELGVRDIGESRIQEAEAKRPLLRDAAHHHFIGHLQTNKARKAVELFDVIQSVDRPSLAEILDRAAGERGKTQFCLVELKLAGGDTRSGIPVGEAPGFITHFSTYAHLRLMGLMAIAPHDPDENVVRRAFRSVKAMFDRRRDDFGDEPVLSMGMSEDFQVAIEEGSTMVRIGRGLFGERV